MCGTMVTSCGMTRTSHCALHLRAPAEHMNNTNAHTTIHCPYGIAGVRSSTIYTCKYVCIYITYIYIHIVYIYIAYIYIHRLYLYYIFLFGAHVAAFLQQTITLLSQVLDWFLRLLSCFQLQNTHKATAAATLRPLGPFRPTPDITKT